MILCALWAFILPAENAPVPKSSEAVVAQINSAAQRLADGNTESSADHATGLQDTFTADAFAAVMLWNPPPPPIEENTGAENTVINITPTPPPNLTLLGIIQEADGSRRAALYDQRTDQIHIVASGETFNNHQYRITSIAANVVELQTTTSSPRSYRITMKSSITNEEGIIG